MERSIFEEGSHKIKVFVHDDNSITTEISMTEPDGFTISARGKAKCNPSDQYVPELGKRIALGRALEKFGRKLAADAETLALTKGEFRRAQKDLAEASQLTALALQIKRAEKEVERLKNRPVVTRFHAPHDDCDINDHHPHPAQNAPQQPRRASEGAQREEVNKDTTSELQSHVADNKRKLMGEQSTPIQTAVLPDYVIKLAEIWHDRYSDAYPLTWDSKARVLSYRYIESEVIVFFGDSTLPNVNKQGVLDWIIAHQNWDKTPFRPEMVQIK